MNTTRTTSKEAPVYDNSNFSTSPDIKALLPEALIKYLWNLALCDDWQNYESQSFILEAGELSGRKIQDISHVCDYGNSIDMRRVYGVEPVNCMLHVLNAQDGYQMQLCANV